MTDSLNVLELFVEYRGYNWEGVIKWKGIIKEGTIKGYLVE